MKLRTLIIASAFLFTFTPIAFADATAVTTTVPWGDWLVSLLQQADIQKLVLSGIVVLVTYASRKLPASLQLLIKARLTDQTLQHALDYAIGAEAKVVKGKTVDLETTNALLAKAEAYVIANAPKLAGELEKTLMPKLFARLSAAGMVAPETTAAAVGAAVPPAPAS